MPESSGSAALHAEMTKSNLASDELPVVSPKPAPAPEDKSSSAGLLSQRRTRRIVYSAWLALTFVVGTLVFAVSWDAAHDRNEENLRITAAMGARAADTYFSTLQSALTLLGSELRNLDDLSAGTAQLAEFKRAFPEFDIVTLTLPDGTSPANSMAPVVGPAPSVGKQFAFQDAIVRMQAGANMVVEPSFIGPVAKKRLTKLRLAVRDDEGRLLFTVAAGLPTEKATTLWRGVLTTGSTLMGLMRDDYYVVVRLRGEDSDSSGMGFDSPGKGPLSEHLRANPGSKNGIVRGTSPTTGLPSVIAYEKLEHYPIYFYVVNAERSLWKEWWFSSWPIMLLMAGLLVGGLIIIRAVGMQQLRWAEEREQQVQALRDLNSQFQRANQDLERANAELQAFSYTVSHDLRAPIRAIDGFTAVIMEEMEENGSPLAREMAARVRGSAARMGQLINGLLELSRLGRQEMQVQTIDMQAKVATVMEELGSELGKTRMEIGVLPPAQGDKVLLRQVWMNLIANAIKYSAKVEAPVVRVGFEDGEYFVEDNGAGFDMQYADKLFQVFNRLHGDREFSGTGVGLAIVRRIIERHGGSVRARGEVGKGARFSFRLP